MNRPSQYNFNDEDTRYAKTLGEDWFAKKKEAARIAWERVNERSLLCR